MDLADRLEGLGYEAVGEGCRGRVLLAPDGGGHAVKLFPADDLAYLSFLRYALANPSPHMPRVLHGPVPADDGWAVVLERLDELPEGDADALLDEVGGYLLDVGNGRPRAVAPGPGDWGHALPPGLRADLLGLGRTLLAGHGFLPDDGYGNVMLRGDVPVLSDPVCGRNGRVYAGATEPPHDPAFEALLASPGPAP